MIYQVMLNSLNKSNVKETENITNNISTGFSIVEKLNEELDIGSMEIMFSERSSPYSMFDTINIFIYNEVTKVYDEIYSMRIGGDSVSLVSKNPLIYSHSLSLVEHTKILERIVISGKTFTQPTDGSTALSLFDVIEDLRVTQPLEILDLITANRAFVIPDELETYLDAIESPEFTFKDITLREALNQVVSYVNGVVRLDEDSNLSIDFYNELVDLIEQETGNYNKTINQDIQLYATDMTVDALNLVADTDINESVEVYPSENAWVTSRSDQYIYNFTKSYIPTPKRIYQVQKLQIKGMGATVFDGGNVYDTKIKYQFYDAKANFPPTGDTSILTITVKYYDISTDKMYYYDESISDYTEITIFTPPSTVHPKISFYSTYSDFPTTDTRDICIARDTGIAYRFNTTFIVLNHIDSDGSILVELTSSDRIVEKNIYSTLDSDDSDRKDPTTYYKSNTLYYTYRENNIPIGATFGIFDTNTSLEYILKIKFFELLQDDGIIDSSAVYTDASTTLINSIDDNETMFRVHYVPIPKSTRFNIDRQDNTDVYKKTTLISNQQSRIVNTNNFLNNIQAKINKIGNSELKLYNRVSNISDIYNVSDYTSENYVVTNKEIIFFKDFIDCSYELSRNWNMLSQFISVNSEIRQWEMGEQNTLQRNLLYKEFIEIDAVSDGNGIKSSKWVQSDGANAFLDTFNINSEYEPIRNAILDSSETTKDLICGMSSVGGGNNLLFNFQFYSNVYVGNYLEELSSQTANQYANYADEDGKMDSGTFYLYDEFEEENRYEVLQELANLYPQTNKSYIKTLFIKNESELVIKKDNREELGLTLQLQLVNSDIQKVILGKALSNKNRLVNESPPSTIYLKVYEDSSFGKNENTKAPDATLGFLTPTLSIDYTNYKITVTHSELDEDIQSWCLTDENNNILIAVNQDGTLYNVLTFSFKNKRTGVVYFNSKFKIYVDTSAINSSTNADVTYGRALILLFDTSATASSSADVSYERILDGEVELSTNSISSINMTYGREAYYIINVNAIAEADVSYERILDKAVKTTVYATTDVNMAYNRLQYYAVNVEANASANVSYERILDVGVNLSTNSNASADVSYNRILDKELEITVDAETSVDMTYGREVFYGFSVSAVSEADMSYEKILNIGVDLSTSSDTDVDMIYSRILSIDANISISSTAVADVTYEKLEYEWVETTEQTPTTNECNSSDDIGNIKVESELVCAYYQTNFYTSNNDETTTIPACSDGATYTLCWYNGLSDVWVCTSYEATEGYVDTYYECQLN